MRLPCAALALWLAASLPLPADAGTPAERLTNLSWSSDGATLAGIVVAGSEPVALAAFEASSGKPAWRIELTALREGTGSEPIAIDSVQISTRRAEALVVSGGDLFRVDAGGSSVQRLTRTAEAEEQPSLAPDGARIAFVRHGDLYALDLASGQEQRLTLDGSPPVRVNGALPSVDLFGNGRGYAWAPESRTIAFLRRENELDRVGLVELVGGAPRTIELSAGSTGQPTGVDWRFDARALAIEIRSATGDEETLHLCSAERLRCLPLARRAVTPDLAARRDFVFLADGFLWGSQSGGATLSRYDTVGRERQPILAGSVQLDRIEAADESRGWIVTRVQHSRSAGSLDPGVRFLALSLGSGTPSPLDPGPGGEVESVAPNAAAWVALATDANGRRHRTLRTIDGRIVAELPAP